MKQYIFIFFILTAATRVQAQVTNNGNIVMDTGSVLIIRSTSLVNNGQFSQTAGTVRFTGADSSLIRGSAAPRFYNLELARSGGLPLQLMSNITIDNQLLFTSGMLDLNASNIVLGSHALVMGERDTSRIIGPAGGYVEITGAFNAPLALNPGNLGAELTSGKDLGLVTIRRGHLRQTVKFGEAGIHRYFDIEPANNSALNATLRFHYLPAELDTVNSNFLGFWTSTDLQTWTSAGFKTRDVAANYVELTGITDFSRWTLAFTDVPTGIFNPPGSGGNTLRIWPLPAHNTLHMSVLSTRPVRAAVLIYNSLGVLVMNVPVELSNGPNSLSFDITRLAAGIYQLKLLGKEGSSAVATIEKL